MTRIFDISGELPEGVPAALERLDAHFRDHEVPYMLVGALARDAVASLALGMTPERATKDIDFAVRVDSMEEFHALVATLERVGRHEHKFMVEGFEIDIVPFGPLAVRDLVTFNDAELDVAGLREAEESADTLLVSRELQIRTASIEALCLLKIMAWRDRHGWTNKDATDLAYLFDQADQGLYRDEVWSDDVALELVEYDAALVGAAWLGRGAGRLASQGLRDKVNTIVESQRQNLIQDMGTALASEQLAAFVLGLQAA